MIIACPSSRRSSDSDSDEDDDEEHASGPGAVDDVGKGLGRGFSVNVAWQAEGMGDKEYLNAMHHGQYGHPACACGRKNMRAQMLR